MLYSPGMHAHHEFDSCFNTKLTSIGRMDRASGMKPREKTEEEKAEGEGGKTRRVINHVVARELLHVSVDLLHVFTFFFGTSLLFLG